MPGPPPSENPRRRNITPAGVVLPSGGFAGEIPAWPLAEPMTPAEKKAWEYFWRTPQAAAWAQLSLFRTVARYVRSVLPAEELGAIPYMLSEVRQLEDRLGLTPMAMLRLRWTVADDEVAEQRASRRPRLSAVDPKAAEEEAMG